ncbi:MAG: hypothetical protein KDE03_16930, partial [Rhodobacteraceae bacterium]|nr:hypothetical protein [Paracoccaceae bacterium]
MKHRLLLAASSLFLATAVHAGIPVEEDITCPVGGETFTIVSTMSCSSMGATMSLRPLTSCDFVTRLPVCPSNGLPLFKDFPADEVARLERYVQTPDYAALRDLAPALRAYHVAKFLGDETDHERLWLLIDAALYDAPASRSDPANLDLLLAEA